MKKQEALLEVYMQAYKSLNKNVRYRIAARILKEEQFSADWIDHLLIERSRMEKGEDISLDSYLKVEQKEVHK